MGNLGSISFSWGAGGNHLRWLLFLDHRMFNPFAIQNKIKFIQTHVYTVDRTWNNWLKVEWEFRKELDQQISIEHELWNWERNADLVNKKILFLKLDNINLAAQHYFHINPCMNAFNITKYLVDSKKWQDELEVVKNQNLPNHGLLTVDTIFNKELDYQLYKKLVDFFGFDDNYSQAAEIHKLYYQARQRSARDFYNCFTSAEVTSFLNSMKKLGFDNE